MGDEAREELSDVRADGVLTASPSIDTLLGLLVSIPLSVVSLDTLLITWLCWVCWMLFVLMLGLPSAVCWGRWESPARSGGLPVRSPILEHGEESTCLIAVKPQLSWENHENLTIRSNNHIDADERLYQLYSYKFLSLTFNQYEIYDAWKLDWQFNHFLSAYPWEQMNSAYKNVL